MQNKTWVVYCVALRWNHGNGGSAVCRNNGQWSSVRYSSQGRRFLEYVLVSLLLFLTQESHMANAFTWEEVWWYPDWILEHVTG